MNDAECNSPIDRYALLPLRVFLGITYGYAGLSKLADPQYLTRLSGQMQALTGRSPIGPLLGLAVQAPSFTGLTLAFGEVAVGLGTLVGLWGRVAAAGGAILSLTMFLSVTWDTHPYFLGSDVVFLMAWTPLLLLGTPRLSLDAVLARRVCRPADGVRLAAAGRTRRQVVLDSGTAAVAVAGVGLLSGAGAARLRLRSRSAGAPNSGGSQVPRAAGGHVVDASALPVGGTLRTTATSGDPVFVMQPEPGKYVAFSAVCTHAGCTVLPPKDGKLTCPCHGSCFDANSGAVLIGPATRPLPRYAVTAAGEQLHIADEQGG
jgi:thiosulfate dehydrogenase [quinone] large subunit